MADDIMTSKSNWLSHAVSGASGFGLGALIVFVVFMSVDTPAEESDKQKSEIQNLTTKLAATEKALSDEKQSSDTLKTQLAGSQAKLTGLESRIEALMRESAQSQPTGNTATVSIAPTPAASTPPSDSGPKINDKKDDRESRITIVREYMKLRNERCKSPSGRLMFAGEFIRDDDSKIPFIPGMIGYVQFPKVIQVIGPDEALVNIDGTHAMAKGWDTRLMVDGSLLDSEPCVEVIGIFTYTTALGASKRIHAISPFDFDKWSREVK